MSISFFQSSVCLEKKTAPQKKASYKVIPELPEDQKVLIRRIENSSNMSNLLRYGIAISSQVACAFANLILYEQFLSAFVRIVNKFIKYYTNYQLCEGIKNKELTEALSYLCTEKSFELKNNDLLFTLQQDFKSECRVDSSLISTSLAAIFSRLMDKNIFTITSFILSTIILVPFLIGNSFTYLEELAVSAFEYYFIEGRGDFDEEELEEQEVKDHKTSIPPIFIKTYSNLFKIIRKVFPFLFGFFDLCEQALKITIFICYFFYSLVNYPIEGMKYLLFPRLEGSFYAMVKNDIEDISLKRILSKTAAFHTQVSGFYSFNAFERLSKDIIKLLEKYLLPQKQEVCKIIIAVLAQFYLLSKSNTSNAKASVLLSLCCLIWIWAGYEQVSEDVREAEFALNQAKSRMSNDCSEVLQNVNAIYPEIEIKRRMDMQNSIAIQEEKLETALDSFRYNLFKIKLSCAFLSTLFILFQQRELLMLTVGYIFKFIEFNKSISSRGDVDGIFEGICEPQIVQKKTDLVNLANKVGEKINNILKSQDMVLRANINNFLKQEIEFTDEQLHLIPWNSEMKLSNIIPILEKLRDDYIRNAGIFPKYLQSLSESDISSFKELSVLLEQKHEILTEAREAYKKDNNFSSIGTEIDDKIKRIPNKMMSIAAYNQLRKPIKNMDKFLSLISEIGIVLAYCFQSMEAAAQLSGLTLGVQQILSAIQSNLSIITNSSEDDLESGEPFSFKTAVEKQGVELQVDIKDFNYKPISNRPASNPQLSLEELKSSIESGLKLRDTLNKTNTPLV